MLPALITACSLYEHPELTEDGEPGIDPTEVNINIDLSLQLKPEAENGAENKLLTRADAGHRHRIIVDAYQNRILSKRQIIYKDITDAPQLNAEISMKLHARDYQLVIWADYVGIDSDEDLY